MLTGVLVPTSGTASVAGRSPWRDRVAHTRHIGVVFGHRTSLWWDLPVRESLDLLRHVYDVPAERFRANLGRLTELLALGPFLDTPVRALSLGQRMRADLAAAMLHDPRVVFLDEPTIGLDVVAKQRIREFVVRQNRDLGITVVLTTHDLGDVEKLCRRILMIDHGRLVYDGDLETLRSRFGDERELVVDFAEDYEAIVLTRGRVARREGNRVTIRFKRDEATASELIAELVGRYRIADLTVREADIEDTVRRIYEERLLL
jgi:ABC-2 type transport system ATP-binding protein